MIKSGSWLCAANWCQRCRAGARHPQDVELATVHVGFRTLQEQRNRGVGGNKITHLLAGFSRRW